MTSKFWEKIRSVLPSFRHLHIAAFVITQPVLLSSLLVTGLLVGVRHFGVLEALELNAFDQLIRLRPDQGRDSRLLVVTVNDKDLQSYGTLLPDKTLNELLKKLEQYQPRVIGLDIFRDIPVGEGHADLVKRLQQSDRTVVIYGVPKSPSDPGIPPPPGIPKDRIGFADFVEDIDKDIGFAEVPRKVIRRHLLWLPPTPQEATPAPHTRNPCKSFSTWLYSFSLQLAIHSLRKEGIPPVCTQGYLKLGSTLFKPIEKNTGGYHNADMWGEQVLLNYRSPQHVAESVTLAEVLKGKDISKQVKDRIVLIGYTAAGKKDYFDTPYSIGKQQTQTMAGVLIHSQMVSQILSTVLDNQPLLWYWPEWGEVLWIWIWSLVGGSLTWRLRRSPLLVLAGGGGAMLGTLFGICYGLLFIYEGWVPLVPSALALIATGGSVVVVDRLSK